MWFSYLQISKRISRSFMPVKYLARRRWGDQLDSLSKTPGCKIGGIRKPVRCRLGICNHMWGTQEINLFCGFTYNVYGRIMETVRKAESKIRLARVTFSKRDGSTHRDVGLVVEPCIVSQLRPILDRIECQDRQWRRLKEGANKTDPPAMK